MIYDISGKVVLTSHINRWPIIRSFDKVRSELMGQVWTDEEADELIKLVELGRKPK